MALEEGGGLWSRRLSKKQEMFQNVGKFTLFIIDRIEEYILVYYSLKLNCMKGNLSKVHQMLGKRSPPPLKYLVTLLAGIGMLA